MLGTSELRRFVEIGIALTTTKNKTLLLADLLNSAMEISHCDAGTLYLYRDHALEFKIMKTLSMGVNRGEQGEKIDLPPVPLKEENVCAYAAIHRELINIPDVYTSDRFDFSGPRRYDSITGYRTRSMLVIPLVDAEEVLIGVLQLMNAHNTAGEPAAFSDEDEFTITSLGSMAAVSLSGMIYLDEVKAQMHSFVSAFATAVDERTPYNGTHTRKVTVYSALLAEEINRRNRAGETEEYFDENRKEQLELAAALHDIGKMIVPLNVMNKATRLDGGLEKIRSRFELFEAWYTIDGLTGRMTKAEAESAVDDLWKTYGLIERVDGAGFLPDDLLAEMEALAAKKYVKADGTEVPYITEYEHTCLTIRKGTLTAEERAVMESHVTMTEKILNKVHFNTRFANVARFAAAHHEMLNGTGYPRKLKAEELELEPRILAVADIFDALTCTDRPYKKPMPRERAFAILEAMVKDGQLDGTLVAWFHSALEGVTEQDVAARMF